MKKHIIIIKSVLAIVFVVILFSAFSACTKEAENPKEPVEFSYTVEEVCSSKDGLNIYGKLYIPKSCEGKMPAVILSHSANLNADSMNLYAAGFAERGFIAYAFDFCGSSSKSRSDGSTDDMTLFSEIEDLKAVLSTVSSMDNVDTNSIYLFGTSQGGLVTALAAEDCKEAVKGEILLYPAFNIPELVDMASGWGSLSGFFGGGYSQAFSDTLKDYDVYAHIGNFSKKVLIIHGSSDFIVNKSYSEKAAERYGDCTLKIIDGAGHGFNKENYSMGGSYDDKVWEFIDEYIGNS
ncbi:MAG: alpha/beta hydrolase family protein [Oscillospiraceae bacterium]